MRRAVAAILSVFACAALAGCGDDDDGASAAQDRLITALENARDSTVRARLSMRVDSEKDGRYEMSGSLTSTGDGSKSGMRARYVEAGEAVTVQLILHEREGWMRSPTLDAVLPPGKRWVRTTDPEIFNTPTMTPDAFADMLKAAGNVEDVGPGRVNGAPARRLRARIDLDELARESYGPQADAFRQLMAGNDDALVTVDVWVTDEELPMRFRVSVRMPREGGGRPQTAFMDLDVDEYDVAFDADPPPDQLVVEESELVE
jgi:hypothetical protein